MCKLCGIVNEFLKGWNDKKEILRTRIIFFLNW
jgi:hypothetical protein